MIKKNFWNFLFIFFIFLTDRLTKLFVINSVEKFGQTSIYQSSFLDLNLIWNSGIAFGLFSFDDKIYYNIMTAIILIIITIILWFITKTKNVEKIAFMMVFGGALGNIFDRLYYTSVPDFIDIHVGDLHWFIFNVADIFISLGIILLICLEFYLKKKYD